MSKSNTNTTMSFAQFKKLNEVPKATKQQGDEPNFVDNLIGVTIDVVDQHKPTIDGITYARLLRKSKRLGLSIEQVMLLEAE